ncbi:MAG TPA: archaeal heat shock protein Hsp20 [Candidatus Thermoplasmatota archaeon]|nr:archaeal heat shock protein Hsp20 [Candidatus Thermoplasmatota archaeon]
MSTPPKDPRSPPDPWAAFPGGNPFGPGGPLAPGGPFGGDPFANMEAWFRSMGIDPNDFRRLVEEMQRNLQDAFRNPGQDPGKSFVSGFSLRIGPDGKPQFATFGNKPSLKPNPGGKGIPKVVSDEREPITDVIDGADEVSITLEVPGVTREDIDVHMTERQLEIAVDTERRKYHKQVQLPAAVDPSTTKATYNNGILDVTVRKVRPGKAGVRVPVR